MLSFQIQLFGVLDANESILTQEATAIVVKLNDKNGHQSCAIKMCMGRSDYTYFINDDRCGILNDLKFTVDMHGRSRESDIEKSDIEKFHDEIKEIRERLIEEGGDPMCVPLRADTEELKEIAKGISPTEYREKIIQAEKEKREEEKRKQEEEERENDLYDMQDKLLPGGNNKRGNIHRIADEER